MATPEEFKVTIMRCALCKKSFSYAPSDQDKCPPGSPNQICDICCDDYVADIEKGEKIDEMLFNYYYATPGKKRNRKSDNGKIAMTLPAQLSPRVAALLGKMKAARGRLIFCLDATASRERTWDLSAQLTAPMFEQAARIGGLDVQLVYYRGLDEVQQSPWLADAHELVSRMSTIRCEAGATQIASVLHHVREENKREKVNAAVLISDACEEDPNKLYDAAANLGVPCFLFQEGDAEAVWLDPAGGVGRYSPQIIKVEEVFRELARLTGGAYGKFDAAAAKQLGEFLRAIAAFAVGGRAALANQRSEGARKLLAQLK